MRTLGYLMRIYKAPTASYGQWSSSLVRGSAYPFSPSREPDCLNSIITQLNWRGDNKIVHLSGATPMLPPHLLTGPTGQKQLQDSFKDFSIYVQPPPQEGEVVKQKSLGRSDPFAQYTVVRGYEDDEVQALGPILEVSTPLKEPLTTW